MLIETLREFIARDNLEEFFKSIASARFADKTLHDQSLILESRFKQIQQMNQMGTLSPADYLLELNRIKQSCVALINQISATADARDSQADVSKQPNDSKKDQQKKWLIRGLIAIPLITFLGYFAIDKLNKQANNHDDTTQYPQNPPRDTPNNDQKLKPNIAPISVKPVIEKSGTKLEITINDTNYQSLASTKIEEALMSKNFHLKPTGFVNTMVCKVTIENETTQSSTGEPVSILDGNLQVRIMTADGSTCFSRIFEALRPQMPPSKAEELRAIENLLFDLTKQLKEALPGNCASL